MDDGGDGARGLHRHGVPRHGRTRTRARRPAAPRLDASPAEGRRGIRRFGQFREDRRRAARRGSVGFAQPSSGRIRRPAHDGRLGRLEDGGREVLPHSQLRGRQGGGRGRTARHRQADAGAHRQAARSVGAAGRDVSRFLPCQHLPVDERPCRRREGVRPALREPHRPPSV